MRAFLSINQNISPHLPWVATILIVILYAASDEWHQLYVESRIPDIIDWIADGLGGLFGTLTLYIWHKLSKRFQINRSIIQLKQL